MSTILRTFNPLFNIQTKILVCLLSIMFVDYAGYGYYVFYLVLIYLFYFNVQKYIDKYFFLLLIWGISYGFINFMNTSSLSYLGVLLPIINCPFLFLAGKYLISHNSDNSVADILFLFCASLAVISIFSIFIDISAKGFMVLGTERNIPIIGQNSTVEVAATGLSSRLLPLASCLVFFILPVNLKTKLILVIFALLTFVCGLRIQSRTLVLAVMCSLLIALIWNWRSLSFIQQSLLIGSMLVLVVVSIYFLTTYQTELAIIDRFQSDEIESGGGRMELLLIVASKMLDYPFGNMPKTIRYAHNVWFDCARVVGLIPFILLIVITILYVFKLLSLLWVIKHKFVLSNLLIFISFSVLIVFSAEPVLEGIPMVFELFCLLFGMVVQMYKQCKQCIV